MRHVISPAIVCVTAWFFFATTSIAEPGLTPQDEAFQRGIQSVPKSARNPNFDHFDWKSVEGNSSLLRGRTFDETVDRDAKAVSGKVPPASGATFPGQTETWTVIMKQVSWASPTQKDRYDPIAVLCDDKVVYKTEAAEQVLIKMRLATAWRAGRRACEKKIYDSRHLSAKALAAAIEAAEKDAVAEYEGEPDEKEEFAKGWSFHAAHHL